MKENTGKAIQFSGYPLQIAGTETNAVLKIVKAVPKEKKESISITNNPVYWDQYWFGNYE